MEQEGPQQLLTTGIFQLNLERTHLKCFQKMEAVRKIFLWHFPAMLSQEKTLWKDEGTSLS